MSKVYVPSPAVSIVGRHNSGKTTLIVKLIGELTQRGLDVGSVKHHSHVGFDIDYPGKDSYRHREAGATETVIASPDKLARVKTLTQEVECSEIVASMPGHDIIIVEGYRKSGLPTIEIMRSGNQADTDVAVELLKAARSGASIGTDFIQASRKRHEGAHGRKHAAVNTQSPEQQSELRTQGEPGANQARDMSAAPEQEDERVVSAALPKSDARDGRDRVSPLQTDEHELHTDSLSDVRKSDLLHKMPTNNTVAIVSDIPEAIEAAGLFNVPVFSLDDIAGICNFLEERFARPRISVVIQSGGESRRMGRSKATVPFAGRPLISRLVERLSPVADELIITTNEPENLAFLDTDFPDLDIKLVRDAFDFRGALPGLYTAMMAARNPYVAVVACDMIFASPSLVVAQSLRMAEDGADVVVPVNTHGYEPFHAMYRKSTCMPAVRRALDRNERRAQSLFDDHFVKVVEFTQEEVLRVEPRGGCFINANTPEELQRIEDSYLGE